MKSWVFRLAAIAAVMLLAGVASAQQFTMKLSSPTVNDAPHEWMKAFKAGVEQRSGGRIKVEIYPASQLGQIPATVDGVAMGTIEFALPAVGFLIGLEPRFQVFDAAGLFDGVAQSQKVLADPAVLARLATFGEAKGGFKYYDVTKTATYLPASFLFVGGVVNRNFMKSIGPELATIVREEARKAATVFSTFGVADIERTRETWVKNGGEAITLPPTEAAAYLKDVTSVIPAVLATNAQMKTDYDTIVAAAKTIR